MDKITIDEIKRDRSTFRIREAVTQTTIDRFRSHSEVYTNKFVIMIESAGGDAIVGMDLHKLIKARGLVTLALETVESAALTIFLGGSERLAIASSFFLAHNPTDNQSRIKNFTCTGLLRTVKRDLDAVYGDFNIELPRMFSFSRYKNIVFDAQEALEKGIVTEII
jgi:ATP-dependent protease ClpP protease subunit